MSSGQALNSGMNLELCESVDRCKHVLLSVVPRDIQGAQGASYYSMT